MLSTYHWGQAPILEYEIREASRCVKNGMPHSDIFRPEDSVAVLGLMDEIRRSWDMRFTFEK